MGAKESRRFLRAGFDWNQSMKSHRKPIRPLYARGSCGSKIEEEMQREAEQEEQDVEEAKEVNGRINGRNIWN